MQRGQISYIKACVPFVKKAPSLGLYASCEYLRLRWDTGNLEVVSTCFVLDNTFDMVSCIDSMIKQVCIFWCLGSMPCALHLLIVSRYCFNFYVLIEQLSSCPIELQHTKGGWSSGFIPIAEYGVEFSKGLRKEKARKAVRLLYSGRNHYDLLV